MSNEELITPSPTTLMEALGIEIVQSQADHIIARLPITGKVLQPFGILHGGATVALAETVASIGTYLGIDYTSFHAVGLEINCNHLHSVREGAITAHARPVHQGRSTWVWDIRVHDDSNRMIAIARCTVAIIPIAR
jgi:1,4-dihydroxy-2-naphthoyl-CoA hydrolase